MPVNHVVCCDGTDNEFGRENTNVVRLVQVLDRDPGRQRVYYDPGVGTLPEPARRWAVVQGLSKLRGLAFGFGLSGNVAEAYTYLMNHWEPGDQVLLFGFSRGAYTVRVLAGMLHAVGLLPRGNENLVPYAVRLFKGVRREAGETGRVEEGRWGKLCAEFRWTFARPAFDGDDERRFPIRFMGLWDTVSSVGCVWSPRVFPYTRHNPSVRAVWHAMALDERRCFYRQNLVGPANGTGQEIRQAWFPGVHADVGGGYPAAEGGLWREPFEWVLGGAREAGELLVDGDRLGRVLGACAASEKPWRDPAHRSLAGLWWAAEYVPRPRGLGLGRCRQVRDGEMIHGSVLRRIRDGIARDGQVGEAYTPGNLSEAFLADVRAMGEVPGEMEYYAKRKG